jgi:hypothetical protein
MRVFENRELRRIFGPKCDEVKGERRKLHNKDVNDLYALPNIIRVIKSRRTIWTRYTAQKWEKRGAYKNLVGKPEGKRPIGRRRRKGQDNIKMDLQEMGWGAWTELICLRIWTRGGLL